MSTENQKPVEDLMLEREFNPEPPPCNFLPLPFGPSPEELSEATVDGESEKQ